MLYGIIMAGGSGTRLWPESRRSFPKQLMTLSGTRSFLQSTADRLQPLCRPDSIGVVTGKTLAGAVRAQLPELPDDCVITEPCARNTSGCVALGALWCLKRDPDATMVLLPADHLIYPVCDFQKTLARAAALVERRPEKLVTLGVAPTYPAESFGYIERGEKFETGEASGASGETAAFQVLRFREKPDRATAETYLASGNFYWNAGIFVWKARTILDNLKRFAPGVYAPIERLLQIQSEGLEDFEAALEREFPRMESISIDYAVMESASSVGDTAVLPVDFSWDDVGSWGAMERIFPQDESGNTLATASGAPAPVLVDTEKCTIRNTDPQKTVACFGVKELAVIVTSDVVLVFDRNREESVREVTKKLKEMNCEELL